MMHRLQDMFRIYMSHAIRGPSGIYATPREIEENIMRYKKIGEGIRAYLIDWEKMDGLPKCDLYVPAEHDEFIQIAYDKKYIDETEILDVDCEIVRRCNLLIAYGNVLDSRGMKVEVDYAGTHDVPILYMPSLSPETIHTLKFTIKLLIS